MNEMLVAPPVAASARINFVNNRPAFGRMVVRGAMLEFVTLGFYRFWLATDIRRHLWTHTSVDGDVAEYTGTGKELLIGFLFALAILAPLYLVYFLIGLEAERWREFASIPLGLFFYFFMQFAIYRARRYRLTRTVWRGVRFSMRGSGWNYAWRAALWTLFTFVTLGLALPWRQAALERFKMRHTAYGDLQGRFDGKGWDYFKRGWWLWLLSMGIVLVIPTVAGVAAFASGGNKDHVIAIAVIAAVAVVIPAYIGAPFIYAAYKAIEWRWWVSGLRFGDVRFESDLPRKRLVGLYWKVIGWSLFISTALGTIITSVLSGAASLIQKGPPTGESFAVAMQHPTVLIIIGVVYIVSALAFGVVLRIYLMHDLWHRVADTVTVHNLAAADNVTAQGQLAGALGEGFADSLDVVGF